MKLNIAAALHASAVNCSGKEEGSGLVLEEEQCVASLYLCICVFVFVNLYMCKCCCLGGGGERRVAAISDQHRQPGETVERWRDPREIRRIGQNLGAINKRCHPRPKWMKFLKGLYYIWKTISNAFPFQSLKNVQESLKNTKNLLYNFFWLKTCSNKHILSFGCNTWIIINPDEDIIIYWLDTLEERTCNSNWCQLGFVKDATEVTVGNWKAIDSNCETDTTVNTATASLSLLMPNWLTVPSDRSQLSLVASS